jgi:hypothetical protein
MADRETKIVNFYESTLASLLASASTSTSLTAAPTTDGTTVINASSGDSSTHYYLVVDPDNSSNREVILVTQSTGTTLTTITRDLEGRHSTDPDHQAGTTVRLAVLAEHFVDMNDRLDTGLASLANAIETTEVGNGLTWTGTQLDVDINGATDGTAITVDVNNDLVLLYDADATAVKKVKASQVAPPVEVHPFIVMGA